MMSELTLAELNDLVSRIQAGELPACDALLRSCGPRLHRLALWMLRKYPKVATYAEVEDLTQNASLRLLRALEQIRPESMKAFYALAALQIRVVALRV